MEVTILGKYGPFSINGGSTSGYLVESNKDACVLDLGSGTVSKLLNKIKLDSLKFVFLSHMHFDHISDFGVLSYAINFLLGNRKINLYMFDDGSNQAQLIKNNSAFNIINVEEGVIYKEGVFEFSFFKMSHPIISYGIKIFDGVKTLSYTGDTTIEGDINSLIRGADLLIADGCFLEKDYSNKKPHMSIKQVCDIAETFKVKTLVSHISYNYSDADVSSEITAFSDLCEVAKEGKTYLV